MLLGSILLVPQIVELATREGHWKSKFALSELELFRNANETMMIINDQLVSLLFVVGCYYAHRVNQGYFQKVQNSEGIQNYSVHVVFPELDEIKERSFTKTEGVISYHTDKNQSKIAFSLLTMRDIFNHFSSNFGPIHRIYGAHEYAQIHEEMEKYVECSKDEYLQQIKAEDLYF